MNMLHMMRNSDRTLQEMLKLSPLKAWLVRHGHSSIVKFAQLEVSDFQAPLVFQVKEWCHLSNLALQHLIIRILVHVHLHTGQTHNFPHTKENNTHSHQHSQDHLCFGLTG